MTNCVIVSDIRLYRDGLGVMLDEVDDITVTGVVESLCELSKTLEAGFIDVLLLDMRMQEISAFINAATKKYMDIKIIVIAVPQDDELYLSCVNSGVAGYLSNESTIAELVEAIITVAKGGLYCPCGITQNIVNSVKHQHDREIINEEKPGYSNQINTLTQREAQIVKLMAGGMSNKTIAKSLTIELSTVKNHVHNILVKMGLESRAQVACLLQENIFTLKSRSLDLDPQIDHR